MKSNPDSLETATGSDHRLIASQAHSQTQWVVEGIKHEIFMRVFPSLRHGLVGPISIARMSISIVRRLLARGEASLTSLHEPVERIDQQLAEAVLGIRNLQNWEPSSKPQSLPLADIIGDGIALMTAPLAMREIVLDYEAAEDLGTVSHHAELLYTWLGVLCYFQDSLQQAATLKVLLQPDTIKVTVLQQPGGRAYTGGKPAARVIDQAALQILASAAGFKLNVEAEGLSLSWA